MKEKTTSRLKAEATTGLPRYAPASLIRRACAPVSGAWLRSLACQGFVRSVKLGDSRQAGRLYHVEDVVELLDRMAVGQRPRQRGNSVAAECPPLGRKRHKEGGARM